MFDFDFNAILLSFPVNDAIIKCHLSSKLRSFNMLKLSRYEHIRKEKIFSFFFPVFLFIIFLKGFWKEIVHIFLCLSFFPF